MRKIVLSLFILISYHYSSAAVTLRIVNDSVPLYEFVTLSCDAGRDISNPFISMTLATTFRSPDGRSFAVEGFYNGGRTWLLRFMPDQTGSWSFSWQFGGESGSGSFTCVSKRNSKLHGHLRVDPAHPHKLRFQDGTPLHWIGGKYIDFDDPFYKTSEHASVPERMPKSQYLPLVHAYLQNIAAKGLNGIVLKLRVLPLNDDLRTMDLGFMGSADQIMQWCMELGINVQVNLFDTWGKRKPGADISIGNPDPTDLLLEPHNPDTFKPESEFYIRYVIARYAAYPNTIWELWNEAERQKAPALAASTLYAAYFRAYDPYQIPISASEIHAGGYPIQVTSMHAGFKCGPSEWNWTHAITHDPALYKKYIPYANLAYSNNRPLLWNECYPNDGIDTDGSQYDTNYPAHDWFRATFWGNLTAGCIGTSEFCWARIDQVPNAVTDYHSYFAEFLSHIKDVNALDPADAELETSAGTATMCRNPGKEYVIYHFTQARGSHSRFQIKLPAGFYYFQYFDPKTGLTIGPRSLHQQNVYGWQAFDTPTFSQDIVLYLIESSYFGTVTPVELAHFSAFRNGSQVRLAWRTESESSNYGFAVERASAGDGPYEQIAFIAGHGTTPVAQDYSWVDQRPSAGQLYYRLTQIDADGARHPYSPVRVAAAETRAVQVSAYPNPGRSSMHIRFHLDRPDQVRYIIYNTLQQTVQESSWHDCAAGDRELIWNGLNLSGRQVASGTYFYRLETRQDAQSAAKYVGRFIYAP